ncbi:Radial spoke head protein 9, partial [Intoshia linei]
MLYYTTIYLLYTICIKMSFNYLKLIVGNQMAVKYKVELYPILTDSLICLILVMSIHLIYIISNRDFTHRTKEKDCQNLKCTNRICFLILYLAIISLNFWIFSKFWKRLQYSVWTFDVFIEKYFTCFRWFLMTYTLLKLIIFSNVPQKIGHEKPFGFYTLQLYVIMNRKQIINIKKINCDMNIEKLTENIDKFGTNGIVLSIEKQSALLTSLLILKKNNKLDQVNFWGIIRGIKDDYYIAEGIKHDDLFTVKIFYSKDSITWGLITDINDEIKSKARRVKGRFSGDPTNEFEIIEITKTINGEEVLEQEQIINVKEEDRLATVIMDIINQTKIVPLRAFIKDAKEKIVKNRNFDGLSQIDGKKLNSYVHFRNAVEISKMTTLEQSKLNPVINFMDSIDLDKIP